MASMWSGSISFGLVLIPVRLHSAVTSKDISFNLLHRECKGRIQQKIFCPTCDRVVERDELVKGYQYAKDQYVLMEDKDFEKLEVQASRNIGVESFVDLKDVDPLYFDRPYYLEPENGSERAYQLLLSAMKDAHKAGLCRYVMRSKEYVGLIYPLDKGMALYVLHQHDEVKPIADVVTLPKLKVSPKEVEMARQIIENMTDEFEPEKLTESYREQLTEILNQKVQGKEIAFPQAQPQPAKVVNLMDALRKSLKASAGLNKKPVERVPLKEVRAEAKGGRKLKTARAR